MSEVLGYGPRIRRRRRVVTGLNIRELCIAALALMVGLAACGDDEEAQELSFTATEGKLSGPGSAETGEAVITLTNDSGKDSELQLIRVEGDHSAEEVIQALGGAQQGKPFPDWFHAGGGLGPPPGQQHRRMPGGDVGVPGADSGVDRIRASGPSDDAVVVDVPGDGLVDVTRP